MPAERRYGGIDWFRMAAAFLIIAIHTSPLDSVNAEADFFFTRVLARIAVPFFFMTTGFFVLSDRKKSHQFLKKTGLLYAAATVLYLPIHIYAGNWEGEPALFALLKDILFDGTFYHLWYLPAVLIGVLIFGPLVRKFGIEGIFPAAIALYLIGLLGDSYYGLGQSIPFFQELYQGIFWFSDYTRNGLFFAPVFLLLGAAVALFERKPSPRLDFIGLVVSFGLMTAEAFWLRSLKWPRHDSMYIMLVPCMYFLFRLLLIPKIGAPKSFRSMSLLIYLLHPAAILMVRFFAKLVNLESVCIDNGIVYFLMVTLLTLVLSYGLLWIGESWKSRPKSKTKPRKNTERTWAEVNLSHLAHNVRECRKRLPSQCRLMAVVKADAYGHGGVVCARHLRKQGVTAFAVATLEEGIRLRRCGIKGEILILGYTSPERAAKLQQYQFLQTVVDYEHAVELDKTGFALNVHIKIDTGMHRLGEDGQNFSRICNMFSMKHLQIKGIYTHLCWSNSKEQKAVEFTQLQIQRFYQLLDRLQRAGIKLPDIHMQSSYGMLHYPKLQCDYARIGIALYGALPLSERDVFLPVLEWKSRIVLVREIAAGESLGYDCGFTAPKPMRIGIVSAGYADGVPRSLSFGRGQVLIQGQRASILGAVCMDQMAVDLTHLPSAVRGSVVTLVGRDGEQEISAAECAQRSGSIANELLSRLGSRVKRFPIS